MKFSLFLALALAGSGLTVSAQEHHVAKAKPSHDKATKAKNTAVKLKTPNPSASTARQLHQIEQQSKRSTGTHKPAARRAKVATVKADRKPNPPIRFGGSGGGHGSMTNQGTNPYKGRLRQKGSHH